MEVVEFESVATNVESVAAQIVDSAVRIHKALGPGLLESVYELCLCHELSKRQISFARQIPLPVCYDGIRLESGFRIDVLVENSIVVELKAVESTTPLHEAQLLTYMKLTNTRLGFLLNFNVPLMKQGIKRLVL